MPPATDVTFDEVLDQLTDLLAREGRVSYARIKRRFNIDDAYVEDLKDELVLARRSARDEGGRVLVHAGAAPDAEGEHRPLTVMFCDLVGSMALARALEPEELRARVRAYQEACAGAIGRFDGHIAQFLGDGILAYFGYPLAHEDSPARAVHAGLGVLAAMARLRGRGGPELHVRVGIHSGPVVVGDVGAGGRVETLALGDTPNIAARVQSAAEVDSVWISHATRELVGGRFAVESMGAHALKGLAEPMALYRVRAGAAGVPRPSVRAGRSRFVGRAAELERLAGAWAEAAAGRGRALLVAGEAGAGKSRLVAEARARALAAGSGRALELCCSAYHLGSALHPFGEAVARASGVAVAPTAERPAVLSRWLRQQGLLDDEAEAAMASLLSLPLPASGAVTLGPRELRARTEQTLLAWLLGAPGPLFCVVEDLHWADPSSLALLGQLIARIGDARVLLIGTHRPGFEPTWSEGPLQHLPLGGLPAGAAGELVRSLTDETTMDAAMRAEILRRTDGIPLFIEELTKMLLESDATGAPGDDAAGRGVAAGRIPATLHDSLVARLDRLGMGKRVAQVASVIGRRFGRDLLARVSRLDDGTLEQALGGLVGAGLVDRGTDRHYAFRHALIQDAAYASLVKGRRRELHAGIARTLDEGTGDAGARDPAVIAHHYTQGGLEQAAVPHWHAAADRAMSRSANVEAAELLEQALAVIARLPDARARAEHELRARSTLGYARMNTHGYGDAGVEQHYRQAAALAEVVDRSTRLGPALYGLFSYHASRAEYAPALRYGTELIRLGTGAADAGLEVIGHNALGLRALLRGDIEEGRAHTARSAELADAQGDSDQLMAYGGDFRGYARTWLAVACALQGDVGGARDAFGTALARTGRHPYTQAFVLTFGVWFIVTRDYEETSRRAEELSRLAARYGFGMLGAVAEVHRAWVGAHTAARDDALGAFDAVLPALRHARLDSFLPLYLSLHADALAALGRPEPALAAVDEGLACVERAGGSFYEPELRRQRAALVDDAAARAELSRAAEVAAAQGARWWSLAVEIARRGRAAEAAPAAGPAHSTRIADLLDGLRGADGCALVREARRQAPV